MTQDDKQKAMDWWNSFTDLEEHRAVQKKYYPQSNYGNVSESEIQSIWEKEVPQSLGIDTRPNQKVYAPDDWGGKVKSNTHYAWIDGKVTALRPTLEFVFYRGRWRAIETDELGGKFIDIPGAIIHFEILEFDKPQSDNNTMEEVKWQIADYLSEGKERFLAIWPSGIVDNEHGIPICLITPKGSETTKDYENAALIVESVNNYPALKELCGELVTFLDKITTDTNAFLAANGKDLYEKYSPVIIESVQLVEKAKQQLKK